jgi:hypothetical protein
LYKASENFELLLKLKVGDFLLKFEIGILRTLRQGLGRGWFMKKNLKSKISGYSSH